MEPSMIGRTAALAEGRQLEELAQLLEKEGATAIRCPLVRIQDTPDPGPVLAWLRELAGGKFTYVVLFTGEGLTRLLALAEREGIIEDVLKAMARTRIVTRGPKPVRALGKVDLSPALVAQPPTTEGVIAILRPEALQGKTVGVQLYNEDIPALTGFLTQAGATVRTVTPYVYAPDMDADHVADLIQRMADGKVDVLVITSSPQVDRLYEVASLHGLEGTLKRGLDRVKVAAIGPVAADALCRRGARVSICPEQGFVMKNLVQLIKKELAN